MSHFEEFIPAEKKQANELPNHEHRQYLRINLRETGDESLALACDGVTVELYADNWWRKQRLGIANIKNIGLGGAGLLSATRLTVGRSIIIEFQGQRLKLEVARSWPVNNKLHFSGAKWVTQDENEIINMINLITKKNTYTPASI
ncbi:hypothetical protein [Shewanella sp. UCD-KL12]|uniref:hypothetical protein n=1 Tax=Shewanella sp. UCD-KL12 TaxID=1917163 RepID=UPI0009712EEA|nr:hypothetical protein [Shewanella sp. UCD-KL12]